MPDFRWELHGGPGLPAYVHLQPLRRSMAPCSPIMQTFSSTHTPASVVHHHRALHGAILRAAHAGPPLRNGGAQQRTVQERVEGWVAAPALPGLATLHRAEP